MNRSTRSPLVAAAVFSICSLQTASADEVDLKEIVVTASMNRNLLDIAQPASVLGGDELARQRSQSLGETLSRQLGVSSSYFGPTASRPVIRGLGGYRVQTLQDGLATLDVGSLSDDHAISVDPSLSEQLEVLKGPATLLHGSGAAGGLVNVVTPRIPLRSDHEGAEGFAELRGDTGADERAGVASLTLNNSIGGLHFDAFKSESGAIDIPGQTVSHRLAEQLSAAGEPIDSHFGSIPNAFSDTRGGAVGGAWRGDDLSVGGSVSRYENTYGIPSEESAYIDMRQTRYQTEADLTGIGNWLKSAQIAAAYNDYEHTEFESPGVPGTEFSQTAYEVRLSATHELSESWRGTFGAQFDDIDFVARGDEAFVPASITQSLGVFALEEFVAKRWTFSVGARLENQSIDPEQATALPRSNTSAMSGAAGAVFRINDTDTLSASLTRTARLPQSTELYANGPHLAAQRFEIGDPSLATEKANTLDVTLRRSSDGWSGLVSAFYNDYDNFVFAAPTGNLVDDLVEVRYAQAAAKLYGFETELWTPTLDVKQGTTLRVRLMSDYTRGERTGGQPLPQMPPLRMGLGLHLDRGAWHGELEGIHHAAQNRLAPNELATDSYVLVNADTSLRIDGAWGEWFLFLRGTNLLDEEARQHTSSLKDIVPLPGRALNAGVRLTF